MEEKMMAAFDYAITTANEEMFDILAKGFEKFSKEDKNEILKNTIMTCPKTDFIQHVLDYGYEDDFEDEDKNSMLHYAAASAFPKTVNFFIKKGFDLEAKNINEKTPLCVAAQECPNVEVVKALVKAGADTGVVFNTGDDLLHIASGLNPEPEVTNYFLKAGFDVEGKDNNGCTPLLFASRYQSNVAVLAALITAGANKDAKTNDGENLLHLSALNDSFDVNNYIYKVFMTSDTDKNGVTCLQNALMENSSVDVIKIFVEKMRTEQVMYACYNNEPNILDALFTMGYDPNAKDVFGTTVLMMASRVNENPVVVQMLYCRNVCVDAKDDNGRCALHYAAVNKNPAIYDWMVQDDNFKKLVDEVDSNGNTAEYYKSHVDEF